MEAKEMTGRIALPFATELEEGPAKIVGYLATKAPAVALPTGGEWKADESTLGVMTQVLAGSRVICMIYTRGNLTRGMKTEIVPDPEGEANLALIVASKKLLRACEEVYAFGATLDTPIPADLLRTVGDAIASALPSGAVASPIPAEEAGQ